MKYLYLLLIILAISSCKSPVKLLEEGKYNTAFDRAVAEVKRGKNVKENLEVIKISAELKVEEALRYSAIMTKTEKVKDWIKTQTKVYGLLEDLGKANKIVDGKIYEQYDALCNEKKDIDYQIVDYFYEEGHDHLDRFYNEGNKVDARHAYKSFKNCEKYEGQSFFLRLAENTEDAYQNGIVYYVSDYGKIGSRLFLKPLPKNAEFQPDCDILIDHGFVSFSSSESSSDDKKTEEIETGTEAVTDTSGNTTYHPIYETVSAKITTKTITITITARVSTKMTCINVTGQCSMRSSYFNTQFSDSYEEVSVSGDERAITFHVDEHCGEPAFFKSNIEDELMDLADAKIGL